MTTTTRNDLPTLNAVALYDIIMWAAEDEAFGERLRAIGAHWEQGSWAEVKNYHLPSDTNQVPLTARELETPVIQQEVARQVRNGECQTAFCIFGAAAIQADHRLVLHGIPLARNVTVHADHCVPQRPTDRVDSRGNVIYEDIPGARPQWISDVARDYLGLTGDEADLISNENNTLDRIKMVANLACENRDLPPLFPDYPVFDLDDQPDDEDQY